MRPHRDAAGGVDQLDRLRDRGARARDVGGHPGHQIAGKQLLQAADPLGGDPGGVVGVVEQRVGEMGAPERVAGGLAAAQLGVVEREALRAQQVGHRQHAPLAVAAQVLERGGEGGVAVVHEVAEDVQLLVGLVHRGELGGGDHAHARARALLQGLLHARRPNRGR